MTGNIVPSQALEFLIFKYYENWEGYFEKISR